MDEKEIRREYYGTPAHPRCINCGNEVQPDEAVELRARYHYRCLPCESQFKRNMQAAGTSISELVIGGPAL